MPNSVRPGDVGIFVEERRDEPVTLDFPLDVRDISPILSRLGFGPDDERPVVGVAGGAFAVGGRGVREPVLDELGLLDPGLVFVRIVGDAEYFGGVDADESEADRAPRLESEVGGDVDRVTVDDADESGLEAPHAPRVGGRRVGFGRVVVGHGSRPPARSRDGRAAFARTKAGDLSPLTLVRGRGNAGIRVA